MHGGPVLIWVKWVKMGTGGQPPEVTGEMDIGGRTSYAGIMPMVLISCRPHRTANR